MHLRSISGRVGAYQAWIVSSQLGRRTACYKNPRRYLTTAIKRTFFSAPRFAVVGASTNPPKYGTKVLNWYVERNMSVTPVHPSESELQGLRTVPSISHLPAPSETSISVITNPRVTLSILEQAKAASVPAVWLQPGAADDLVRKWINDNGWEARALLDGPCVLTDGDTTLKSML